MDPDLTLGCVEEPPDPCRCSDPWMERRYEASDGGEYPLYLFPRLE